MPGFIPGAMQGASAGSMFGPWGAAIGAVAGGVLGSAEGDNGARDAQQAREAFAERQYREQFEFQNKLAREGVRWRVEDAKLAGIHPALALGMQPFNASPISLDYGQQDRSGSDLSWLGAAGHNVARSMHSTRTDEERRTAEAVSNLALERAGLQNELLRAQILSERSRLRRDQVGPGNPDPANPGVRTFGTPDALIEEKPLERSAAFVGRPYQEAGAVGELGFSKTPTGYAPVMSKDFKERAEDDAFSEIAWHVRNRAPQTFGFDATGLPPPETWLPPGAVRWVWHPIKQEWQPSNQPRKGWTFFRLSKDGHDVAKF